jgi:dTDP-4-dehydrorhamnose reductase
MKSNGENVMELTAAENLSSARLLISGVDTVLGANMALTLSDRFPVSGLFENVPVILEGCATRAWSPDRLSTVRRVVRSESPQWIIHCGPLARGSWDLPETVPDPRHEILLGTWLATAAAEVGARLTVITTDAVFSGPWLFHDEKATANSRQPTAMAARRLERALDATGALVVRTNAYGWGVPGGERGLAELVWQALSDGGECPLDPNCYATPILASALAELLVVARERGLEGLYHIAGSERTSAHRFGIELASAFGLETVPRASVTELPEDCLGTERPETGGVPARLHETSLVTRRARHALERPMPTLREGLERFAIQATQGYRRRICPLPLAA